MNARPVRSGHAGPPAQRTGRARSGDTAYERGWARLSNGELLEAAERAGFQVLVTTDSNLRYQQNLSARRIAIAVLSTTSWPRIQRVLPTIVRTVERAGEGGYCEVPIP